MNGPCRRAFLGGAAALFAQPSWAQADPVAALADEVSTDLIVQMIHGLSSFPTRFTDHPDFPAVTEWLAQAMAVQGEVTRLPFRTPSGKMRDNLVLGDVTDPRGVIMIGAHYDSTSEDPLNTAPGANDNATGVAAMLEARRVLSAVTLDKSVVAVAFAGEEQGLLGSAAVAHAAQIAGWPIEMMINLDMLGWRPPDPAAPMVVEYDMGNAVAGNDAAAEAFGRLMAEVAAEYSTLATSHTDIWSSDYMPFEAAGFPAVGLYDGGADGPRYHNSRDIMEAVDFDRVTQATRIVVAAVARFTGL